MWLKSLGGTLHPCLRRSFFLQSLLQSLCVSKLMQVICVSMFFSVFPMACLMRNLFCIYNWVRILATEGMRLIIDEFLFASEEVEHMFDKFYTPEIFLKSNLLNHTRINQTISSPLLFNISIFMFPYSSDLYVLALLIALFILLCFRFPIYCCREVCDLYSHYSASTRFFQFYSMLHLLSEGHLIISLKLI